MPARILICDDNPVFRKALRRVLESADHWEIVEAHDGEDALSTFQEIHPDLVILDLAMPVRDGLSAAREISKLSSEVPIFLYTMHNSPQLELEARKAGIRKTLSKSDSGLLIATIRQLLGAISAAALRDAGATPPQTIEVLPTVSITPMAEDEPEPAGAPAVKETA
jgi:DNA-binding NarL/FixJ family response regulator